MLVKILVKILGAAEKSKKSENFGGLLEACFGHLGHQSPLAPHRVWSQRDTHARAYVCGRAGAHVRAYAWGGRVLTNWVVSLSL